MPKVSVITIAKKESNLRKLKKALKNQTYKNFEFIYSTKKGIPQAWNDAIKKAKGEIIVVTESDALPLTNKWLEEMVSAVKKFNKNDPKRKTVIRGIEVQNLPWNWCNFASYARVLKENLLNEKYPVAEDTELFARLRSLGYKGLELPIAPVFHNRGGSILKLIKNNFLYGILLVKIQMKYNQTGFKSTFNEVSINSGISLIKREIGLIIARLVFLLGTLIGFLISIFNKK